MTKIPFYLVTGFLGSGKTTLLKSYIEKYSEKKKIAIIQNEFSEVNIDSTTLKRTEKTFDILEINNGSVFCVCLLGDFITSLNKFIIEHQPEVVILEASGLSDPISICQILASPVLSDKIWLAHIYTVVDTLNFQKTVDRILRNKHQIRIADTVVLNKCDLVSEDLSEIEAKISIINPFGEIIKTSFCNLDFRKGFSFHQPIIGEVISNSGERPHINSVVIKTTKLVPIMGLKKFIEKWSKQTYRIKGFVQTDTGAVAVQTCFEHKEYQGISSFMDPTLLVILGPKLDNKTIKIEFEELCTRN